ncbi:MazG-like family protein [Brucella anthropi]|uniref:MazG-like family protein n=1 Tax=Brucella anthropi TaxID=529 RepID=UPI003D98BDF1
MTGLLNLRAANVARDQEWNTGTEHVSMTFRATEFAGEVGEACNVIKKLERERIGLVGSRDTKEHLAEELADIVICTDLIAMDAGIDLDAAVAAKFNATSEKNGLATRLSISPAMALPFEATPEMVKAALDLVWEESETHGDLVCRLWRAMAAVAPDTTYTAREQAFEKAARLCDARADKCAEDHQSTTLASVKAALAGARSEAMHLAHSIRSLSSADQADPTPPSEVTKP